MLAHAGVAVTVVEAHSVAGGAAHSFERDGFSFDSGPSFYFGLQARSALREGLTSAR